MARAEERNPATADGDWYIDVRCIDCEASREVAPGLIVRKDGKSVFARQPRSEQEEQAAWRAALLCPTASVAKINHGKPPAGLFPEELTPGVYRCGYNARSSFGAHSYFVRRANGNLLVDSPRHVRHLLDAFSAMGGIAHILLTHRDDVAEAERYAKDFGARVWIHEADRDAARYATDLLTGEATTQIDDKLLAIPVPGHTRGSVVYLSRDNVLFAGDSLAWNKTKGDLTAFRDACWYSWSELKRSLARLADYRFEWLLPGHGNSVRLDADDMRRRVIALTARM